jgi:membrane protein DedA with SNARE-associated domain
MSFGLDQILPSLQSLGLWSYWIIGLASALEAFFITSIVTPGTLVVDAGGIMVERGLLDYFDLVWFVAIGSVIGGELSYLVGRRGVDTLKRRLNFASSPHYMRAERLFLRHGGMALVTGGF